jgi:hypothetical protein
VYLRAIRPLAAARPVLRRPLKRGSSGFFAERPGVLDGRDVVSLRGMWITIALLLAIARVVGFLLLHTASFAIHILLVAAVIAAVLHFVLPATRRATGP